MPLPVYNVPVKAPMTQHLLALDLAAIPVSSSCSGLAPEAPDRAKENRDTSEGLPHRVEEPDCRARLQGMTKVELHAHPLLCRKEVWLDLASDLPCHLKQVSCPL